MTELETRLIALVKSIEANQLSIIQELKSTNESIETLNKNQNLLTASLELLREAVGLLKESTIPFTVWLKRVLERALKQNSNNGTKTE